MTQIIIRDGSIYKADNTLLMGDARQMMGREVMGKVVDQIESHQNMRAIYYVLITTRQSPTNEKEIHTKIVLTGQEPPKMLGTMCFKVDNEKGRIDRLWVLPLDRPSIIKTVPAEFVPEIAEMAKGMPIIHG